MFVLIRRGLVCLLFALLFCFPVGVASAQVPDTTPPTITLQRIYLPQRKKETQILTGTPSEAATKLTDILIFEVRVI